MDGFKDKVAIITGGASGIGRALCEELGRRGTSVVVADVNSEGAEQVAAAITDNWGPHEIENQCREAREMGVPLFRSFTGACRALNRVAEYYRFLGRQNIQKG